MNKTLLLIICDFLLLNLLALTRWEQVEPLRSRPPAPAAAASAGESAGPAADLVEVMRLSLEDERAARDSLASQLDSTRSALAERETRLDSLEEERTRLAGDLQRTSAAAEAAAREAEASRIRLAQLQRDLELREQEAARQREALARLEREQAEARARIESLNVAVAVAEQEKTLLRENLEAARTEVAVVREEKDRIQEQAGVLAEGVGRLAERSGELTREIRDHRPINANTLFSEFLDNQVATELVSRRTGLFGPLTVTKAPRTVLVSDGDRIYALLHLSETPLSIDPPVDYEVVRGTLRRPGAEVPVREFAFFQHDPRVALVPVDPAAATRLGVRVYRLAADPFKFPEAVLVGSNGRYYGETEFRLDPATPRHVRMNSRILSRLFGEFSPSTGDLVFSKTGELLGVMVNASYCAVLLELPVLARVPAGERAGGLGTREPLEQARAALARLPLRLQ